MRIMNAKVVSVVLVSVMACAGNSPTSVTTSDVTAYDQAALQLGAVVDAYRSSASTMATPADCTAAAANYRSSVVPLVDRMQQMANRMDDGMRSFGHPANADMMCGAGLMRTEVEQHSAVACISPDLVANRAEALRHCDAMGAFDAHLRMRCAEMGDMVGTPGSGMGWNDHGMPMMDGGMPMGGGWMMPDGGMMGWDHQMPGCTYADGGFAAPDGGYWADGGWMMDGGHR